MKNNKGPKIAVMEKAEEPRTTAQEFKLIPYEQVRRSEGNPRKTFDPAELKELADSILDQGIIQPLVVRAVPARFTLHEPDLTCDQWTVLDAAGVEVYRAETENRAVLMSGGEDAFKPYFELLAGERRYRAAEMAGLKELPCMVRTADEIDAYKVRLMENDQRVNLNDLERAEFYQKGIAENGFTPESLAKELKRSRSHVFGMLALLRLSGPLREALHAGKINKSIAERVAQIPGEAEQKKLLGEIVNRNPEHTLSVRDVEDLIRRRYVTNLAGAKFDLKDARIHGGACVDCPKRTGNMLELFPNLKGSPNDCTDPFCFESKQEQHLAGQLVKAEFENGRKPIPPKVSRKIFNGQYLMHGSGYVESDQVCMADKKGRELKQLLKEVQVYAAHDGNGEYRELFKKDEADAALKELGLQNVATVQGEMVPETSEEKRKRELKSKLEEELDKGRGLAVVELAEKSVGLTEKAQTRYWQGFMSVLMHMLNQMSLNWERVFTRRGIEINPKVIDKLPFAQLQGIALEMLLLDGRMIGDAVSFDPDLVGPAAQAWGLDEKAMEKRIRAEFAEANRLPKEGEEIPYTDNVEELKAASVLMHLSEGRIPGMIKFRGYFWVETGAEYGPGKDVYNMMRVVPAAEYSKRKFTYSQKSNATDHTKETMGYEGIVGEHRKEEWVLTGPEFNFVVTKEPAPKAEKKTPKKKK